MSRVTEYCIFLRILRDSWRKVIRVSKVLNMEETDRDSTTRKTLWKEVKREKMRRAIELYKKGPVTLKKAAEIAGVSLWDMIEYKNELKVPDTSESEDLLTYIINILRKLNITDIAEKIKE